MYDAVIDRVEGLIRYLPQAEQPFAQAVVDAGRNMSGRRRVGSSFESSSDDPALRAAVANARSALAKGSSKTLAAQLLGDAVLADISGDGDGFTTACDDCDAALCELNL